MTAETMERKRNDWLALLEYCASYSIFVLSPRRDRHPFRKTINPPMINHWILCNVDRNKRAPRRSKKSFWETEEDEEYWERHLEPMCLSMSKSKRISPRARRTHPNRRRRRVRRRRKGIPPERESSTLNVAKSETITGVHKLCRFVACTL
jgi:hypothetical protein